MGELSNPHYNSTMRVILLLIVAAAFVSAEKFDYEDTTPSMEAPEESLLSVVKELRQATDNTPFSVHGMRIEDHANLIQKARAYKHSFGARNALRAAIRALVSELTSGHNHDRNALNNERNAGHNAIRNASNRGKGVTRRYREKACPTKKAQVEAEAARNSAKSNMNSWYAKPAHYHVAPDNIDCRSPELCDSQHRRCQLPQRRLPWWLQADWLRYFQPLPPLEPPVWLRAVAAPWQWLPVRLWLRQWQEPVLRSLL